MKPSVNVCPLDPVPLISYVVTLPAAQAVAAPRSSNLSAVSAGHLRGDRVPGATGLHRLGRHRAAQLPLL